MAETPNPPLPLPMMTISNLLLILSVLAVKLPLATAIE
jgi:hypothetical protein